MTANRVYAMSAITALTAQNTTGVTDIMEVSPKFLAEQLDGIFTDIYPDAVKTGMVASGELIQVIADKLTEYKAGNIVVDPVIENGSIRATLVGKLNGFSDDGEYTFIKCEPADIIAIGNVICTEVKNPFAE